MADIFLINKETGEQLRLPLLPDKVTESGSAEELTYSIISIGEVSTPRGTKLTTYKWEGFLPGEGLGNMTYVQDWQDPATIVDLLRQYKNDGAILQLMVTETQINVDVFIVSFEPSWSGGDGGVDYSITLKEYRRVLIMTTDEAGLENPGGQDGSAAETSSSKKYYLVKATAKNSGGYSHLYKSASASSSVLKKIKNGSEVLADDNQTKGKFVKAKYSGKVGWIQKADLAYVRTETTTTTTVVSEVRAT